MCEFHPIFITTFRNRVRPPIFEGRRHSKTFSMRLATNTTTTTISASTALLVVCIQQAPPPLPIPTQREMLLAVTHTQHACRFGHSTPPESRGPPPSWFFISPRQQKNFPPFLHSLFRHFSGILEDPWAGTGRSSTSERTDCVGVRPQQRGRGRSHFRIGKRDTDYGGTFLPGHLCRVHGQRERGVCAT